MPTAAMNEILRELRKPTQPMVKRTKTLRDFTDWLGIAYRNVPLGVAFDSPLLNRTLLVWNMNGKRYQAGGESGPAKDEWEAAEIAEKLQREIIGREEP